MDLIRRYAPNSFMRLGLARVPSFESATFWRLEPVRWPAGASPATVRCRPEPRRAGQPIASPSESSPFWHPSPRSILPASPRLEMEPTLHCFCRWSPDSISGDCVHTGADSWCRSLSLSPVRADTLRQVFVLVGVSLIFSPVSSLVLVPRIVGALACRSV